MCFLPCLSLLFFLLNTKAPPPLSDVLPTTQSFMFQHMEEPKAWDVLHAKLQRGTGTTGPTQRGGAERSINCREGKWVCLPLSASLFNRYSCLVLGGIRAANVATPPTQDVTCKRSKQYSPSVYFVLHQMHHIQVFPSTSKSSATSRCKQLSRCSVLLLSNANMFRFDGLG